MRSGQRESFAKTHSHLGYDYEQTFDAVKYGYLQAEMDLALTWEDIRTIFGIINDLKNEGYKPEYITQAYCEEILRRFNKVKEAENVLKQTQEVIKNAEELLKEIEKEK